MTLTPEQLDELEQASSRLISARVAFRFLGDTPSDDRTAAIHAIYDAHRAWEVTLGPETTLHLVSVYRAALAWSETLGRPLGDRAAYDAEQALIAAVDGQP